MDDQIYTVYILECNDGTLYTGCTNHLERRLAIHNSGKGAKYTKTRLPVRCVYKEEGFGRSWALRREYALKKLNRKQKLQLILERRGTLADSEEF